jgi:thiol-disulfide isomerase/thioredoxin
MTLTMNVNMKTNHLVRLCVVPLFFCGSLWAYDTNVLKVGDLAPPFGPGGWVQGEPITRLEPGTAYLIEFWATWCAPCRKSVPHLNRLHESFKDRGLVSYWPRRARKLT